MFWNKIKLNKKVLFWWIMTILSCVMLYWMIQFALAVIFVGVNLAQFIYSEFLKVIIYVAVLLSL